MRRLTLSIVCSFITIYSFGQDTFKRNDIYLEAGGNGLFASVNYERQVTKEPGLGLRFGVGFYTENNFYLTIPVGINYLFKLKNNNSFLEAGLGVTWARMDAKIFKDLEDPNADHFTNFIPSIGYRRHLNRDVMLRVNLTPVANKYGLVPWLGLSLGKRFRVD